MLPGIILVLVVSLFRLIPAFLSMGVHQPQWMANFSPMAAVFLCSAAFLPRRLAFTLPFAALIGTDLLLNWHYTAIQASQPHVHGREFSFLTVESVSNLLAFAAIAYFGWLLRAKPHAKVLIPAAVGSSAFFYFVTNTASWLVEPGYAGNLAGWAQAMTTGLPQYQPTWQFYRNTFVSDIAFTLLFVLCMRFRPAAPAPEKLPSAAW